MSGLPMSTAMASPHTPPQPQPQPQPQSDLESGKPTSLSKLNEAGFDEEGYPLRRVAVRRTDMDLYKLDPRRPCEFKLNRNGEPVIRPLNAPYQITAAFAYTLGDVIYPPCAQCSRNNGPWQQCVVYTPRLGDGSLGTPFWKGGCSNCHYSNKASACSLRAKVGFGFPSLLMWVRLI